MLRICRLLTPLAILLFCGCRPPDVVHRYVPAVPDLAIYDGVYFVSRDGMEEYDRIVLVPDKLGEDIRIVFRDGEMAAPSELAIQDLEEKYPNMIVSGNDGQGNCDVSLDGGMQVEFTSYRVRRVDISKPTGKDCMYAINIRGKHISVRISHADLEAALGPPDEIKLDTWPEGE